MATKAEEPNTNLDAVIWVAVIGLVMVGVYLNSRFAVEPLLYRAIAGVAMAAVAVLIALQSSQGKAAWELAKEARVEIRKVVWPTPQERTQTTLIVVVVVIFVALILWGLDSAVSWAIQALIG